MEKIQHLEQVNGLIKVGIDDYQGNAKKIWVRRLNSEIKEDYFSKEEILELIKDGLKFRLLKEAEKIKQNWRRQSRMEMTEEKLTHENTGFN